MEKSWAAVPRSVGRARAFLHVHLDTWGLGQLRDCAGLVVSELVTNAVTHGHPPHGALVTTRLERCGGGVRIEVRDCGGAAPRLREASPDDLCGRGLYLVDALTGGQWGVSTHDGPGKTVWALCAGPPPPQAQGRTRSAMPGQAARTPRS